MKNRNYRTSADGFVSDAVSTAAPRFGWIAAAITGVLAAGTLGCDSDVNTASASRTDPSAPPAAPAPAQQPAEAQPPAAPESAARPSGTPVVQIENPNHDFGTTTPKVELKHAFTIKNSGDAPLEILDVHPGCGCTATGEHPKVIAPGASGQFPFTLDPKELRGRYDKSITITTNDPARPVVQVNLRGVCDRKIDIEPPSASFAILRAADGPQQRTLKITNKSEKPMTLALELASGPNPFRFELVETKPGKEYELRVTAQPPYPIGSLHAEVRLKSNIEGEEEFLVEAGGKVPARIEVMPPFVRLYPVPPGANVPNGRIKQAVYVMNYGDTPLRVTGAVVDEPQLTTQIRELEAGKRFLIELAIPVDYELPPSGRTLTIKTDDAQRREIRVSIQSVIPRGHAH